MDIHFKFYGVFRTAAKTGELVVPVAEKNPTVRRVIFQLLAEERFEELKHLLFDSETSDPRPNALIMVSGREISALKGLETELTASDEVAVLPIAHGG